MAVKIESNAMAMLADVHSQLPDILLDYGKGQQEKIEDLMADAKHGRQYKNLPRRSSAPGEAPAVQSGDLQASVLAEKTGELEVTVYSKDPKAEDLELGTKNIEPRQSFTPVFHEAEHEFDDVITGKILKIVEGHTLL